MDFKSQVILITGASNGIGRRLALDLATKGAVVIGCGRSQERLDEMLTEVRHISSSSAAIACDIGQLDQVRVMIAKVLADFGKIDILINNAGIGMRQDRKSTRLNSSHQIISYAVFCLKKKTK